MQYIECIGVPGSGKTEVMYQLTQYLEKQDVAPYIREPLQVGLRAKCIITLHVIRLLIMHPGTLALWRARPRGVYATTPHVREMLANTKRRFLIEAAVVHHAQDKHDVFINDEGILGKIAVISFVTGISTPKAIRMFCAVLPKNIHLGLVNVNVDTEIARTRIRDRDVRLPFFDDMSVDVHMQFCEDSTRVYREFAEELSKNGAHVISLDNNATREALSHSVARSAKTLFEL